MRLATRVLSRQPLADGVLGLRLGAAGLPAFEAGAHVDLHLGNGLVRSYSLTNDGREPAHYELAVGLAADSRGGSAWVHQHLQPGATIEISAPRNHFALDDSMRPVLLEGLYPAVLPDLRNGTTDLALGPLARALAAGAGRAGRRPVPTLADHGARWRDRP